MQKIIILLFCLGLICSCSSIERGNFGPFQTSLCSKNYGYLIVDDPTGSAPLSKVEKFEVRQGDCGYTSKWSDCSRDRERCELSELSASTGSGDEYWYGWYIYFPEDFKDIYPTKVTLGQFHQRKSDRNLGQVAWMFQIRDGGYQLEDILNLGRNQKAILRKLIDKNDLRGKWHKIEIHVRLEKNNDGFMRIWVNGEQKVDFKGRTMSDYSVYLRYGLYRSFIYRYEYSQGATPIPVPGQIVYFANVKRGISRSDLLPVTEE